MRHEVIQWSSESAALYQDDSRPRTKSSRFRGEGRQSTLGLKLMMKRMVDLIFCFTALLFLWPLMLFCALVIKLQDRGPVFYKQERIGKDGIPFKILKYRTMVMNADKMGPVITVGMKDKRITKLGYFLRRTKLDELPQLFNIIMGDMSVVGPRPEVKKYVDMYSPRQLQVLTVRPGLTDFASIEFIHENRILGKSKDPEADYINKIMPAKLELNLRYIREQSFVLDLILIAKTLLKIR
jgi:lipopolysaccharide/colanic/teichoic acid biosynthesis glycosyltransferase